MRPRNMPSDMHLIYELIYFYALRKGIKFVLQIVKLLELRKHDGTT